MRTVDPEKQAARRRHILEAAAICFARNGFHQTKTAEICAEAGMSPGNVFHYFASKDAIIEALVEEDRLETVARFDLADDEPDLLAALLRLVDENLALFADPFYARLSMEVVAEAVRNRRVFERVARNEAQKKAELIRLLTLAAERGDIATDLDLERAADWILLLLDGAHSRAVVDPAFAAGQFAAPLREAITGLLRPCAAPAHSTKRPQR